MHPLISYVIFRFTNVQNDSQMIELSDATFYFQYQVYNKISFDFYNIRSIIYLLIMLTITQGKRPHITQNISNGTYSTVVSTRKLMRKKQKHAIRL